jgi:type II secretory pathway pseudopilin PulG
VALVARKAAVATLVVIGIVALALALSVPTLLFPAKDAEA